LASRLSVTWWRFGLPETSVSVHVDGRGFHLEQPGASLCSAAFQHAAVIVYRRRLLQPRPLVASDLSSPEDRAFSEREWTSLIDGLLLAEERHSCSTWLNSPSATLLAHNKLSLLLFAAHAGLPVPPFSVSTPVRFPPTSRRDLVTKAISSDERIDTTRFFSTALLSAEDLRDLPGARISTPPLLQEYVPPGIELRVFYILGEFLSLALSPSREHIDIRHVPRTELSPRAHDLPPELRRALTGLARAFALGYCTFDLLMPDDGSPVLIDVTPNGDWDHFESDAAPIVTEFLADAIVTCQSRTLRDRQ
jgi:glutathione synthase/RimK-type ligase-like ATP-grasp enzyme